MCDSNPTDFTARYQTFITATHCLITTDEYFCLLSFYYIVRFFSFPLYSSVLCGFLNFSLAKSISGILNSALTRFLHVESTPPPVSLFSRLHGPFDDFTLATGRTRVPSEAWLLDRYLVKGAHWVATIHTGAQSLCDRPDIVRDDDHNDKEESRTSLADGMNNSQLDYPKLPGNLRLG